MTTPNICNNFKYQGERGGSNESAHGLLESQVFENTCNAKTTPISSLGRYRSYSQGLDSLPQVETNMTSSENVMSCGVVVDKVLQQCTLLTYPGDPLSSPVYPIYEVPLAHSQLSCCQSKPSEKSHNAYAGRNCRPSIRPLERRSYPTNKRPTNRTQSNEREQTVDNWIESVPIYELNKQQWESHCYDSTFSSNWEEDDMEAPYNSNIYFQTTDELLYFLAKKFEAVVRKMYQMEKEPSDFNTTIESPQVATWSSAFRAKIEVGLIFPSLVIVNHCALKLRR